MLVNDGQQSTDREQPAQAGVGQPTHHLQQSAGVLNKAAANIDHNRLFATVCDFDFEIRTIWAALKRELSDNGGLTRAQLNGYIKSVGLMRDCLALDTERELQKLPPNPSASALMADFCANLRHDLVEPLSEVMRVLVDFRNQGGTLADLKQIHPDTWYTSRNYDQVLLAAIDKTAAAHETQPAERTIPRQAA